MKLAEAVRLQTHSRLSVLDASGKTTTIFRLAEQVAGPVIIAASMQIGLDQVERADHHFIVEDRNDLSPLRKSLGEGVTLITGVESMEKRVDGLSFELLGELNNIAHSHNVPLLIQADGKRVTQNTTQEGNELRIPDFVDAVIVLEDLRILGKPFSPEIGHNLERYKKILGLKREEPITPQGIVNVLVDLNRGLKNIPKGARKIIFLNQVDTHGKAGIAKGMAKSLLKSFDDVLVGSSLDEGDEVEAAFVKVAGIVLAAGGSARMGTSKQLLEWEGKPLVRAATEKAIKAGLDPVLIVTGASHQKVREAVNGLEVEVIHNADWDRGQSTSVKAGINALADDVGAAIFLLVDQPKVPVSFIEALVDTHARTLAKIVLPMVDHKRGNPVLFDRITFEDLTKLEGDVGGRQLFSRYPLTWIPWVDSSVFVDVDTIEDYESLFDQLV